MIRVGAQCSIAPGFKATLEEAAQAGLEAVQIFSRSPVGGQTKGLPLLSESLSVMRRTKIEQVFVHAPYFVNPAALDPDRKHRAEVVLSEEMTRAQQLGARYMVMHPGHGVRGQQADRRALASLADTLVRMSEVKVETMILLENAAGQGRELGADFSDLAWVFDQLSAVRPVGMMLDTAHALAAGCPLVTSEDWRAVTARLDDTVGLHRLRGIHLNDNMFPVGSHRDRHAHLLEGQLGVSALSALLEDAERFEWPLILETPGSNAAARADDLAWIRKLSAGDE